MNNKEQEFQSRVEKLQEKYRAQLPEKFNEIDASWQQYRQSPTDEKCFEVFYRVIHTLKGTAATFGFNAQSEKCFGIQKILMEIESNTNALNTDTISEIQSHLDELQKLIDAPSDSITS